MLGKPADGALRIGIVAPGVWRRRKRLAELMGPDVAFSFGMVGGCDAIAGWGLKGDGRQRAEDLGKPYLALEDAFIAKVGGDEKRFGLLGLAVDPVGIYYDASQPSFVEELIAASADHPATTNLVPLIRELGISKFNPLGSEAMEGVPDGLDYDAIVVDQIAGDLSIAGGLAKAEDFERMLTAAIDVHGASRVAVKLHPYDGVGGRTGHLGELAKRHGLTTLPHRGNWMTYAERASRVYVVSSNAGLEALIAGADVSCFGTPFFGGWGLTEDVQPVSRRTARPTLSQLCQAVYGEYGRYWSPSLERQATVAELGHFIEAQRKQASVFRSGLSLHGVQKLKRSHIAPFVEPAGDLSIVPKIAPSDAPSAREGVWASRAIKDEAADRQWAERERLFVEDGFLRSAGLGADLIRPASLVFDEQGIYFDPSRLSDLETMLRERDLTEREKRRGANILRLLKDTRVSKYNVGGSLPGIERDGRPVILVPGQVENDASILRGAGEVRTNRGLLLSAREAQPDALILYKPHPDVEQAGRPGHVPDAEEIADHVLSDVHPADAIDACDELHTMTSLMGFEALIRGKAVRTYGAPFYAGWGLTEDDAEMPRRGCQRSIEELVYLSLVAYPHYVSPKTFVPCGPEDVIELLAGSGPAKPSVPGARAALRLWRKLRTAPDYLR
ncbi:capsular polysaccharide biosynthesis protein [Parvularcula sp. ZS-1/3]|uniref:Capsular polysaccharide biosynthesis protein n=1 Tax=Parvularcula mediterranea TaxID=2732508 RepID=A0A7Y3RMD6_9PROT|nr:capsular polysaccharide biosynthesis protein [Parvularcula mediterranea]NNU16768.1 capsular polysaccharide biosynthesis protein [Parvularcula mediterranea]